MRFGLVLLCSFVAHAQSLQVYSEFAMINANGVVTAPANPREILSPAIVRNGFTSFQIVVKVAPQTSYWLYVGQNPEDAVKITVYRESGDKLERIELPYEATSTQVFWMDLWTDRDAPVRRVKVEPQIKVDRDWVTYPMEVRVMDAVVPSWSSDVMPPAVLCNSNRWGDFALRNAVQDAKLATRLPKSEVDRLTSQCAGTVPYTESYLKIRDYLFRMR